jgi:hypothetical protein
MAQKELLLKDLCARLPYGVKCKKEDEIVILDSVCNDGGYRFNFIGNGKEGINIEQIKPYLFPPKSLPVEKAEEICKAAEGMDYGSAEERVAAMLYVVHLMNKYHVDYRGLIPMDLAIDATNLGIYE